MRIQLIRGLLTVVLVAGCFAVSVLAPNWLTTLRAEGAYNPTPSSGSIGLSDSIANAVEVICASSSTLPLGPDLARICSSAPAGSTATIATGSIASFQYRQGMGDDARRAYARLGQLRDGTAASADIPGLRGLSFFANGEYSSFGKDATSFEAGFDRETWGITVGGDYSFAGRGVVGLAFNYNKANAWYDVGGGGFDIESYGPLLYGSVLPIPNLFIDGYAGYAWQNYSSDRRINFNFGGFPVTGKALGDTDGHEFKLGLNIGYDFVLGKLTVGPRVGVNYKETTVDAFSERGSTGLELRYSRHTQTSLTTVAGLFASYAISVPFGVVVPQFTAEYVHEFENDQKFHTYQLVQDLSGAKFRFVNDPPDRDYFNLGAGVVVVLPQGITPFVNYRELLGYRDQHNHTVTAGVRFSF